MEHLIYPKNFIRKRFSSYDRSGGNSDWMVFEPGQTRVIADPEGAGCIRHIWCTIGRFGGSGTRCEKHYLRKIVLRIFWDGSRNPSVEVPVGDFFGMGHGICRNFVSMPLQMSPQNGSGFNCWFPMPYSRGARIEILNECNHPIRVYYYIDYDAYKKPDPLAYRFHAVWNRKLTKGISDKKMSNMDYQMLGENLTGESNYVILDVEGRGTYVGCNINIHNRRAHYNWDWPGEGDDMIFVDSERFPPSLHGTGTEDYVNMAFCPTQEYSAPYHGLILGGGINWAGKITYYRYHIQDPIPFTKSIRVTIEHGHANRRSDDWSSTAYWYQKGICRIKKLDEVNRRIPLRNILTFRRLIATLILWPVYKLIYEQ